MLNSTCKTKHFWNFMHETCNMNFFLFNLLHYNFSFMSLCISFYIFQQILFNVDIFTCGCVTVVEPQLSCHTLFTALLSALLCTTTLGAGGSATTKPLLSIKLKKKQSKTLLWATLLSRYRRSHGKLNGKHVHCAATYLGGQGPHITAMQLLTKPPLLNGLKLS